jgi:cytosine/adenosine deaminase-related metal-dependent hydrolase
MLRGLSPHAPYSVHPDLYRELIQLAVDHSAPVAVHLAETQAELELLASGAGPLVELLRNFGAWRSDAIPRGSRTLDYLQPLADVSRGLVVHGNYLSDADIDFLAEHKNLTVVYCPRTHAYFGHAAHPWRRLLARGVNVAIGTDSRASNPDLSLWHELRFLVEQFPDADRREILELGTQRGARALGLDAEVGTLTPGKSADLAVVALPAKEAADPAALLFDARSRVTAALAAGRVLNAAV